jgi:CubicO group peptidase (beta-lactamase class C family)
MDSFFSLLAEKNKAMGSIAISKNGQVVYSNAIGYAVLNEKEMVPSTINTRYRIGSITKMFTGVIIFRLAEEKKLSLDDKLDKYFPSVKNASKISIGQLLNHRSGIHNFTADSLYLSYNQHPKTQQQLVDIIAASPADLEPDSIASYSNSNYLLLGFIAEQVTKKTYSRLVKEMITDKIDLPDTYVGGQPNIKNRECYSYSFVNGWKQETVTDMSIPGAAGAIVSTSTGLVKFIDALFAGKLVSPASLEKMKTLRDRYGMAMFGIPFYEKKGFGHNGGIDGFSSMLTYFPADSLAIAYCSNGEVYPLNDIMIGALSIYFSYPYILPSFKSITLTAAELDPYTGSYSNAQLSMKISITRENLTLIGQGTGQPSFVMEPSEKDIFKFEKAHAVFEFNPARTAFTLKQGGGEFVFTRDK